MGLVGGFGTQGKGAVNWQCPACEAAGPSLRSACVQPQARISPHWPSKHLHNAVWQPWRSGPWEEDGTSQGQAFPVKIPQPGLGLRDGRAKVGARGLGSEGLSRGCCLPLRRDARDASAVWGLGSRASCLPALGCVQRGRNSRGLGVGGW